MSTITVYLLLSLSVLCTIKQGQSCLDGFPSVTNNTCTSSSCPFQGSNQNRQLRLFPSMRITCNGMLVGLSVAGETRKKGKNYPILQIWRPTSSTSNDYISEYPFPIGCTQLDLPNNVWQCTISPSIDVEMGDIIGINLPRNRMNSAFRIYFTSQTSFTSYILGSTSDTTFSVPGSTTASVQPVLTLDIREQGIIAGPLVGGVVGVLLLVLIVLFVVILLLWNRKRSRYNTNKASRRGTHIENMAYDDVCINTEPGSIILPRDNINYDIVMESCGDYDEINDNQPVGDYETTINPNDYCSTPPVPPLSEHDIPMATMEYKIPVSTLGKGIIPHPLQGIIPPGEWGLVVPSQEQRSQASTQNDVSGKELCAAIKTSQYSYAGPAPKFFEECETYWAPSSQANELYEQLAARKYREILREQIQITEFLGSGAFGTVNKGVWQSPGGAMEVAIKTNQSKDEEDKVKFLQEAAIMGQFRHPNVVKLYGVVTVGEPVMIVLDLLSNGDLRHFLIKMQPESGEMVPSNTPKLLLKFCQQISSGMDYLARKAFVHRDLAARNILVSEDKVCKISDFGMSRDLMDESYYVSQGGKIPVKWTAPEALNFKKYSVASDVWSFGCVMYEIWSLGHKPFEDSSNVETIKMVDKGVRLPPPPGCPRELYKLMIECWHSETSRRPSFHQLVEMLSQADFELLLWNKTDSGVGPQVTVVGTSLEAAKNLYTDLQNAYMKQPNN
ncbi:RAF proto-oncogene serine/threonine-protein kinase-like isoform X2 [Halichondria panicea]|uniref:RAF proto-oncogene serine/threonine-protein kinase-like isoform X2 n=1 Tax=Halichondria panicea TaxID=6063 RepID=UPI00312B9B75